MMSLKKTHGVFALSGSIGLQAAGTITLFSLNTNIRTLFVLTVIVTVVGFLTV